jgi:hypothetical protein
MNFAEFIVRSISDWALAEAARGRDPGIAINEGRLFLDSDTALECSALAETIGRVLAQQSR